MQKLPASGFANKPKESQTAKIKYKVDGENIDFMWNGNNKNEDLQNISFFNNNCVQISLTDNRGLLVSPIGFHLFDLISYELGQQAELLQRHLDKHPTQINWISSLHPGTPQYEYIVNIKGASSVSKLEEISKFNDEYEKKLNQAEADLKTLNKQLLETEISKFRLELADISTCIAKLAKAKQIFESANFERLAELNRIISELENKATVGIKDIAESNDIKLYQSKEFDAFIKAADEYLKVLGKNEYPDENDVCVYCNQKLSTEKSKNLLRAYQTLLNDNTQELLKETTNQRDELISTFLRLDPKIEMQTTFFGADGFHKPVQPENLLVYNKQIEDFLLVVTSSKSFNKPTGIDIEKLSDFFINKQELLDDNIELKVEVLNNLSSKEQQLLQSINELFDRKFLSSKIDEIKIVITNKSIVSKLLGAKTKLSTNTISRKTSEAREELLKQDFIQYFETELNSLRKSSIKVQINFGTEKGKSKMQQRLNSSYVLSEILSEGEQKAIALAEFLTELQFDNSKSPVIFDDPVNSLDHHIIDDVARRLSNLSKNRQVVIFTHSILLFNSFLYLSKTSFNELEYKFYDIKSEFGKTGIITNAEEEIDKANVYIKSINKLINNTPKDRNEVDLASDGYSYLRSAIELVVEHNILKGTVKRYQKNVALTNFLKVDGELLNQYKGKLNEIFERCCGYIKGHSSPTEIITQPTMEELKHDFNAFQGIYQQFLN